MAGHVTPCPTPVALAWQSVVKVGPAVKLDRAGVIQVACKRWRCEHCGTGKRAEALKLIRAGAAVGLAARPRDPLRFVTITYKADNPRSFDDPADVKQSSEDWREFVKAWRRRGRTLEYVRVLERTKRGRIHIHAITWGDYLPKCTDRGRYARGLPTGRGSGSPCYCTARRPCIQRMAWAAGFGWVEVRAIRSPQRAAAYVAKYLGKQTGADWPTYARRMSTSRRFADGLRLMDIHSAYVAEVVARLTALGKIDPDDGPAAGDVVDWHFLTHRCAWSGTRAPPALPGFDLNPAGRWSPITGERLPSPF